MTQLQSSTSDRLLREIVESVLYVARLGETDHYGWWGTQSFGAAGRVVLKQRLPKTWRMAAIEIDIAAASNRHNEIIDRSNAVHLFSDNWPVQRWAKAWVAEGKTTFPYDPFFQQLEVASLEDIRTAVAGGHDGAQPAGKAVRLGSIGRSDFDSPETLASHVRKLAALYLLMEGQFTVPYLDVEG